jgi:hypothetical protein
LADLIDKGNGTRQIDLIRTCALMFAIDIAHERQLQTALEW